MNGVPASGDLLRLDAVGLTYPAPDGGEPIVVLQRFDLSVAQGEFVVIAGRSGSGKTSALKVAAGLLRPGTGKVCWTGEDITNWPEARRDRGRRDLIGFVFQSGGLIPTLTAAENVALPALARGASPSDAERARDLLVEVGISRARVDHVPGKMSGGEQQRVGLARALFSAPPLLLVDEPTANLDRTTASGITALLVHLREEGRALVVATHDPELIDSAQRVIRLE